MADETAVQGEVLRTRDFTGRAVLDGRGEKIGSVGELLINRRTGQIEFLDVDFGLLRKQHVLVPVERIEWGEDSFVLARYTADEIKALPSYDFDRPVTTGVLDELVRAHPTFYGRGDLPAPAAGEARVIPLKDAKDFKLAGGAPNLKGWNVFGEDGERVGTVTQMLVDPVAMKIRYLDVDLLDDLFLLKDDRHVLIPLEAVELRERGNDAWIHGLGSGDVARLPAYTGGAVDPVAEAIIQEAFVPPREAAETERP